MLSPPPLLFFLPLPSSYPTVRVLLLFVALFFAVSVSPSSPVVTLSGPSTPFDAPEGPLPLFRPTVPPRNIFVASCLPARLPRDSLSTSSPSLHRTATTGRPLPLYILHIINYQPYSRTHSLPLPSPHMSPRILSPLNPPTVLFDVYGRVRSRWICLIKDLNRYRLVFIGRFYI